jgi:hypothetical protein
MAFNQALAEAALAAVVLGAYVRTVYPSMPGGDSGELVAEACQFGTAHPPGYPLNTLGLGLLLRGTEWTTLPPSVRANLASCVLDTIAACLVFRTVMLLCPERPRLALPAALLAGVRLNACHVCRRRNCL